MLMRRSVKKGSRPSIRSASGEAAFEFIMSILTIMFVVFWMWELVMAVYTLNVLSDAAKEGVRLATVSGQSSGSGCPNSAIVSRVQYYAKGTFHDISGMTVTVTFPDGNSCASPNRVRVEVLYNYVPYMSLPITPALRTAAEGRIVFNQS